MRVAREWEGLLFLERLGRASGRAIVAIGMQTAVETKRVTHVQSGNLRRSVHAAPPKADHTEDEQASSEGDLMMTRGNVRAEESKMGPMIEVGSWLEYACVEWVGRQHPGIQQGLEAARGARADAIVAQAFAEEGLR